MASNNKENAQNTVTINKTDANAFFKKAKLDLPFSFKPRMDSLVSMTAIVRTTSISSLMRAVALSVQPSPCDCGCIF